MPSLDPSAPRFGRRRASASAGWTGCRGAAVCLGVALVFALAACGRASSPPAARPVRVVATFSILGDWAAQVGGDRIAATVLVGPDGDAHAFEPTPRDGQALARADVIVEIGLGFEPWLDKLYTASGSKAKRVVVTQGIEPRKLVEDGREETDPHIWHDVKNAIRGVQRITDALAQVAPPSADAIRANGQAYVQQLEELDAFVVQQVEALPKERRKLVTSHDTFGYFAARYGFEIVGAGLGSVSTETADPSAQHIAALVRAIRQTGVPTIFAENVQNPKLMEQIAREAKVKLVATLYTDALGAPGSAGATYLKLVRFNVQTIVEALKP